MKKEKDLGLMIKEIRESRGLTQRTLADAVDIDSKHLSRIETARSTPSLETLFKIAETLQCDMADLFKAKKSPKSKVELLQDIEKLLKRASANDLQAIQMFMRILLQR